LSTVVGHQLVSVFNNLSTIQGMQAGEHIRSGP
jgi:hypothetical protein